MPALQIGQEAPDFTASTNNGRTITLSDFRGKKNVVLVMYPGDQTADCTRQLCAFRDEFPRFVDAETEVFGVNPSDAESHQRFIDSNGFPFDLLIDEKRNIAQKYDSVMLMGFVVKRTVVAIDKTGKIAFFKRGYPTNDEILIALKSADDPSEANPRVAINNIAESSNKAVAETEGSASIAQATIAEEVANSSVENRGTSDKVISDNDGGNSEKP